MTQDELPEGTIYKGPHGIARDSTWLTQEDIPHDRDTEVVVENVLVRRNVKFQGGRVKPVFMSLKFIGKVRELGLNATNRKTMAALFGDEETGRNNTVNWFGKRVALFVEQGVRRPDGTIGPAVRIRAKRLPQKAAGPAVDNPLTIDSPPRPTPEELEELTGGKS